MGEQWTDYKLISEGEVTLGDGTLAYEFVSSGIVDGGYSRQIKCLIIIHELQAFFALGFSTPDRFEQDEAILDKILYSFRLE